MPAKSEKKTTRSDESILIYGPNKKAELKLKTSHLVTWCAEVEAALSKSSLPKDEKDSFEMACRLISRFGIRTPGQIITFLKSPNGKTVIAIMHERLAERMEQEKTWQQMNAEQQLRHQYALLMMLGLAYEHEARKERTIHELNKQTDQKIAKLKASQPETQRYTKHPETSPLALHTYQITANALSDELQKRSKEAAALKQELLDIEIAIEQTDAKYKLYDAFLADLATDFATLPLTSPIAATIQAFENKIATILSNLDATSAAFADALEQDTDTETHPLLQQRHAQHLQIAALQDMLAVLNGHRMMYTLQGGITHNFAEAAFILPIQHQIQEHAGVLYYVKAGQNVAGLTPALKTEASEAFKQMSLKPEFMSVQRLVGHQREIELSAHHTRRSEIVTRSTLVQLEMDLLERQLTTLQALSIRPSPKPAPAPANSTITMLQKLGNAPITQKDLNWLKGHMQKDDPLLDSVNRLKAGQPIPVDLQRRLLNREEQLGTRMGRAVAKLHHHAPEEHAPSDPRIAPSPTWPPKPKPLR